MLQVSWWCPHQWQHACSPALPMVEAEYWAQHRVSLSVLGYTVHDQVPNIPQNSSSAVLLFYTDQMNRVHSSEEAPRSFTMAPCIVAERLQGKQRCSRAAVSESTQESKPEDNPGDCSRKNERSMKKRPNPATHTQPRQRSRGAQTSSCWSTLVRGRSTQFIASLCRWPQRRSPETRLHFRHFLIYDLTTYVI